ncbi:MAG TPA: VOC family protein [Acidimicrobiales bacterium]|nr:VOC family protein [Acidimicrobiales bacterium]
MGDLAFSHVGVCCSDLERSTRFYEALGFAEVFTMELGEEVSATMEQAGRFRSRMLARGDVRVELLHWLEPEADGPRARRPMTQLGITHLCFRVDDVDAAAETLEQCGGQVHRSTRSELPSPGAEPVRLMYVTDPDGVRVELMSGVPEL